MFGRRGAAKDMGEGRHDDAQARSRLEAVRRLRQSQEAWECSARLARVWITSSDRAAYRPHLIMAVTADSGPILRSRFVDDPPTPRSIFEELLEAMRHPMLGAGSPRRPRVIYLDDQERVAALSPGLAEIGVRCEYRRALPMLEEVLRAAERHLDQRDPLPGLLTIPQVTVPLVGHLFELAADFYRESPWHYITGDEPIEIRYPPEGAPRYAVVMGSGGEVFGLAVYDSLNDLRRMYADPTSSRLWKSCTWLLLFFEEPMAMGFDDLDDMERYGWAGAGERAYPVFARTTGPEGITTPTAADLFWLEGALAGILAYGRHHIRFRGAEPEIQPAELTLPVETIGGERQVYLRLPVAVPLSGRLYSGEGN